MENATDKASSHLTPFLSAGLPCFVDTNVLVYAGVSNAPLHHQTIAVLDSIQASGVELWFSRQIVREYLSTMTRPPITSGPTNLLPVLNNVRNFLATFRIAEDGAAVTAHLLQVLSHIPCGGKQIHDANIVATMLACGVSHLLTNNGGDFSRFGTLITVLPIVPPPASPPVPPPAASTP